MWRRESTITSTPSQATADDHDDNTDEITAGATAKAKAVDHHRRMMRLIDVSIESANMSRSEAACNIIVHYPVLQQFIEALSLSSLIQVEPIMAAQIAPCFRPTSVSSHSTTISQSSSLSAHKMVDFALVLRPDGQLQQLIAQFLARPDSDDTINQTLYPPLTTRPAPVFIETKGPGGTPEAANVQLSIWVAAWHERIHSIMGLRGTKSLTDRVITLPVIEVMSGVWHLLFAVDAESEIQLLDRDFRIGDTNSVVGMYQLQAALSSLARWIDIGFKPWITKLLSVVVDT
ncbi:hypothetical protein HD806DRAFT_524313 [Xylariaceae sp. AK1471]|nr:hypothetical protein HD806DRAFT_524313 [Xylariaceae sp. AK1471]